jgi:hypothetical protein
MTRPEEEEEQQQPMKRQELESGRKASGGEL